RGLRPERVLRHRRRQTADGAGRGAPPDGHERHRVHQADAARRRLTVPLWSRDPEAQRRRALLDDHRRIAEPLLQHALANARTRYAPGPDPAFVALSQLSDEARRSICLALIADGLVFARDPYVTREMLTIVVRGLAFTRDDAHIIASRLVAEGGTRN